LVGFSMGGRIALVTTSVFAEKIDNLYLIAPDGIEINAWYRVATKFSPLQGIFKYFTHSETSIYRKLVKEIGKYGLVHRTVLKLAETEMSTPEKRKKVYKTWMLYRFLEVETKKLAKVINENHINTLIYIGKYDRLINEKTVNALARHLEKVKVEVLESGHYRLIHAFRERLLTKGFSEI
jgi:pimeloyl-ACP methyl ester carboxylesterase